MSAAPTALEQPELFDAQQPPTASPARGPQPPADAGAQTAFDAGAQDASPVDPAPAPAPARALRRGPGGPGRVILRPARRSVDVLDRPALEALCHAFGLAVVGERDEVLRDRLSAHLRCR